ncbi:MAG TPA: hypothetical protein VKY37_01810 [Brumimicrobium sp.]|nr:hypothetical protein [Brumimicrobium sp.]
MKKNIVLLGAIVLFALTSISQTKVELVKQVNPESDALLHNFSFLNGAIAFFESDETGCRLWTSDGTSEGTQIVKEINPFANINGAPFIELNGKVYFFAHDERGNSQLKVKDFNNKNSEEIALTNLPLGVETRFLKLFNNNLYFNVTRNGIKELWMSDGTPKGTRLFKDIEANLYQFTIHNGKFYFTADNGNGFQPWVSDGTFEGTFELQQLDEDLGPLGFTAYKNRLYFSAVNENTSQLWITDGTIEGTKYLKNIDPHGKSFTELKGKLYFAAAEGVDGYHLWVTDGTEEGTQLIKRMNPKGNSFVYAITEHKEKLYFSASDGNATQLWISDGTEKGTKLLKVLNPTENIGVETFTALGDKLYFFTKISTEGRQLFETDGTEEGTKKVKIDNLSQVDHNKFMTLEQPSEYKDALYFGASYTNRGAELYKITNSTSLDVK